MEVIADNNLKTSKADDGLVHIEIKWDIKSLSG